MKSLKNIVSNLFYVYLSIILLFFGHVSYTQENDDLYFNKNDRKIVVQKNSLSAQEIINQYKNDL